MSSGRQAAVFLLENIQDGIEVLEHIYVIPTIFIAWRIRRLTRYYGVVASLVVNLYIRNTWCVCADLLHSADESRALKFQEGHMSQLNMIAVSGSIVASVATTALQLPRLPDVHWTASAFIIGSLVFGLSAVFIASKQQKLIARLLHPSQIINFIGVSKNIVTGDNRGMPRLSSGIVKRAYQPSLRFFKTPENVEDSQDDPEAEFYVRLPSMATCLMLAAPRLLLASSVVSFLAGMGIYFGGLMSLEPRGQGSRDVFIAFCVVTFCCVLFYAHTDLVQTSHSIQDAGDLVMEQVREKRLQTMARHRQTTTWEFRKWWRRRNPIGPGIQARSGPLDKLRARWYDKMAKARQRTMSMAPGGMQETTQPASPRPVLAPVVEELIEGSTRGSQDATPQREYNEAQPLRAMIDSLARDHAALAQEQMELARAYSRLAGRYGEMQAMVETKASKTTAE